MEKTKMEKKIRIPIKARIYSVADGRYAKKAYANVTIGDYLSINSYSVGANSTGDGLVVYRPSVRFGENKFKKIVEYVNRDKSRLEKAIEEACIRAYKQNEFDGTIQQDSEPIYIGIEDLINTNTNNYQVGQESSRNISLDDDLVVPF